MNFFYAIGRNTSRFFHSFILFFAFIGHVSHSAGTVLFGSSSIAWINILKILYNSGTAIAIPLMLMSLLLASTLGLNIYFLLENFNLSSKALPISQTMLARDLLPLLIGLILCVQTSLNLIIARVKITKLRHGRNEIILNYILPIIIGTNMTALLLYAYTLTTSLLGLFYTFHYYFNMNHHEYMNHITHAVTITDLMIGSIKTLLFGTLVSLTSGYYYYQAAIIHIPLRTAVSRILTRGALWIAVVSALLRFLSIFN
ncbi:ABC transport system permease [Legionella beliardensis]|uniref:ABC transport system permease n=1 Tax=Legionella beliardensis TaxID=91822 RepID=A0A378HZL8_9GAMM|nr:ABC transporter permease [Legionella beliardensis]STX28192.1 ABC transport system permease [Legionella beliardensis]